MTEWTHKYILTVKKKKVWYHMTMHIPVFPCGSIQFMKRNNLATEKIIASMNLSPVKHWKNQFVLSLFVYFSMGSGSVSKVRVRHSYQDIVEACCKGLWPNWPGLGGWMVNVAQVNTHITNNNPIFYTSVCTYLWCENWDFTLKWQ